MVGEQGARLSSVTALIAVLGCVSANFTLVYISGFALNLSFVALMLMTVLVLLFVAKLRRRALVVALFLISFVLLKALGTGDLAETLKSASQIILAIGCLTILDVQRGSLVARDWFATVFARLMALHAVFLILQFIALNWFQNYGLQNPFGGFSAIGPAADLTALPAPYLPHALDAIKRPNGLFSEPSVAAAYSGLAWAFLLAARGVSNGQKLVLGVLLAAGMFVTFALTGWVILLAIVLFGFFVSARHMAGSTRLVAIVLLLIAGVSIFLMSRGYLAARIEGFSEVGGSFYIRFTAPFLLALDVMGQNLFGLALNDPSFLYTRPYLFDFAGRPIVTLDNFYLWLITYGGLIGLLIIATVFVLLGRTIARRGIDALPLVVMAFFAGATGGGYSAIFVLPLAIALSFAHPMPTEDEDGA
jgi:hypothetical protein